MPQPITLLGLSGSFRASSFNTALLRAAAAHAPAGVQIIVHDYREVPLYNADVAAPAAVEALKDAVTAADGVLIATPEFNHGIPGTLKNAIDWASRPAFQSPFAKKPVGVMSASPGPMGGVRAQAHLQNVLQGLLAEQFPHPGVAVGGAGQRFVDGVLTHEPTIQHLAAYLAGFADFVRARR